MAVVVIMAVDPAALLFFPILFLCCEVNSGDNHSYLFSLAHTAAKAWVLNTTVGDDGAIVAPLASACVRPKTCQVLSSGTAVVHFGLPQG